MSHAATKWAFDQPEQHHDMKPSEWAVLMVLADCHNPVNGCFPSQEYIRCKTNLGERAVRDQLTHLRDRGLIDWDIARENGRRGSNRYRLAFEPDFQPAKSAGSSTGKIVHEQPAKSDSFNRQNLPPNLVREPVKEPEREARASEREEGKPEGEQPLDRRSREALERRFWKMAKNHPGSQAMPKATWLIAWMKLSPDEQDMAEERYPHWLALLKRQGKSHIPALSTYFDQRLFDEVTVPEQEPPTSLEAPPFGPLWSAARMKQIVTGPKAKLPPLTAFQQTMVDTGKISLDDLRREQQAKFGWPMVNAMHERALSRKGVSVAPALEALAEAMEPVPVGSDMFDAWRVEHDRRGWPWIPDPGGQRVVYFPAGGPAGLREFEALVKEAADDGDKKQAAG